jgi:hypothetical protein
MIFQPYVLDVLLQNAAKTQTPSHAARNCSGNGSISPVFRPAWER